MTWLYINIILTLLFIGGIVTGIYREHKLKHHDIVMEVACYLILGIASVSWGGYLTWMFLVY